jgi:hypothetical protein
MLDLILLLLLLLLLLLYQSRTLLDFYDRIDLSSFPVVMNHYCSLQLTRVCFKNK